MVEGTSCSSTVRGDSVTWRLWLGIGFIGYVVIVLVLWAFIAGATRRPTPRPADDLDRELEDLVGQRGPRWSPVGVDEEWDGS